MLLVRCSSLAITQQRLLSCPRHPCMFTAALAEAGHLLARAQRG